MVRISYELAKKINKFFNDAEYHLGNLFSQKDYYYYGNTSFSLLGPKKLDDIIKTKCIPSISQFELEDILRQFFSIYISFTFDVDINGNTLFYMSCFKREYSSDQGANFVFISEYSSTNITACREKVLNEAIDFLIKEYNISETTNPKINESIGAVRL